MGLLRASAISRAYKHPLIFLDNIGPPQVVKKPPEMRETWVPSLGWEDPLEEGMAGYPLILQAGILAWRIPWTEEPDRLQSMGSQRVIHD